MVEVNNCLRSSVLSGLLAALGEQDSHLRYRRPENPSSLELKEIQELLETRDLGNEVAYLRDAGVVTTETFSDGTVKVSMNPEISFQAAEIKQRLHEEYDGDLERLVGSGEYLDFEAPDGWPSWEGPEFNDPVDVSADYGKNMGPLCAVMSMYGEERLQGADITEYSVNALKESFSLDDHELELDLESHLETLERLGYVERHYKGLNNVYRLADDEEVKEDAERIAEHRDRVFSGYPQNMALAYEEADRVELEEKGVKLVQRSGELTQ